MIVGADADHLAVTAQRFIDASEQLGRHRVLVTNLLSGTEWHGPDAADSRREWSSTLGPALTRASSFTGQLGVALLRQAEQQRVASAGATALGTPSVHGYGGLDGLSNVIRDWLDDLRDFLDGDGGDAEPSMPPGHPRRGLVNFEAPSNGRDAIVASMNGLADGNRIRRDEIEVRALDNGRYIVVLPGVVDLSVGFDQFIDRVREGGPMDVVDAGRDTVDTWRDNDEPTVRKMRYAYQAARSDDVTENEYSTVVTAALEEAGVPADADVMLIGHSFGAYTAVDLAAGSFNRSAGRPADGFDGYGVNVTHVVAAGAETDWRFGELPASTDVLIINSRVDGVYRAEDLLHADGDALHPNHVEHNFWGGFTGYGHDESHYIDHVATTKNDDVSDWLDGASGYADAGTRFSVRVPDPNL